MSTNINAHELRLFVTKKIGNEMSKEEAKRLGIKDDKFAEIADVNDLADIDAILDDDNLYAQFATMLSDDKEKATVKDKEKEEEENNKVKDKKQAKA